MKKSLFFGIIVFMLLLTIGSAYADAGENLTQGLFFYAGMNELSGTTGIDSALGRNGTLTAITLGNGGVNNAGWTWATANTTGAGIFSSVPLTTDQGTFSCWFNSTSWTTNPFIFWSENNANFGYVEYSTTLQYFRTGDGAGDLQYGSPSLNVWHHMIVNVNASNHVGILDGAVVDDNTLTNNMHTGGYPIFGHYTIGTNTYTFRGMMDECAFWNRSLSYPEMIYLYNGTNRFYPFVGSAPVGTTLYLNVTAKDNYDQAVINFTATINGVAYSTTNGTANTNINVSDGANQIKNITITSPDYFTPGTYYNQNVSSGVFQSSGSFESDIYITAFSKVNKTQVLTFALNDSYLRGTAGAGIVNLKLKSGYYGLTLNNSVGFYNNTAFVNITRLSNTSINFTTYNAILNLSVKNAFTNASIYNWTGNASISSLSFFESFTLLNQNTTLIYLDKPFNYTLNVEAEGYGKSADTTTKIFYLENALMNYTMGLYTNNSIFITILDENSGNLITGVNITIVITTGATEKTYNTGEGTYFLSNLTDGSYTGKFSGGNYSLKTYNFVVASGSTQFLNVYLALNTEEVIFSFLNRQTGANIEDVSFSVSRIINGSWSSVASKTSDITGRVQFEYTPLVKYRFYASKTGYSSKTWDLDPVIFDSYNVLLDPSESFTYTQDYSDVSIVFYPKIYQNNALNNLTFVFSSPAGVFEYFGYNISYPAGFVSYSGVNAYGGVDTSQINITGAVFMSSVNITTFYKSSLDSEERVYHYQYLIEGYSSGNYTFKDLKDRDFGIGIFEKTLIATLVLIVIFAIASLTAGFLAGAGITALVFVLFTYLGYIPLWGSIISVFVLFMVFVTRSSR